MGISERLIQKRKAAGLTQQEIADRLGIKYQSYAQYERGVRNPKYQTVEKIAKALNCTTSELLDSKEEAAMIIDHVIDRLKERKVLRETGIVPDDDDIGDAFAELNQPGIIAQRYTRFIAEHPLIMQTLKEIGVELEIIDWRKIRIKYDYQETEERTSELLSNLESLHENFVHSIKDLFKNNYGFDMSEED